MIIIIIIIIIIKYIQGKYNKWTNNNKIFQD